MTVKNVFAVVLAAGLASRYGATKQLQRYRNTTFVARTVRLAESVCGERSLLVTGYEWRAVFDACHPLQGFMAHNFRYRSGMASSIAAGVRSVLHTADAVILMLADQPLITNEHLETLLREWNGSRDLIVATAFAGTMGPPVLFPASCFSALSTLQGDRGAREILAQENARVRRISFEPASVDIDRPEDLAGLP